MMPVKTLIVFFVFGVWMLPDVTESKSLFEPCRASDPALEKCLQKAAQNALPTFIKGIPGTKLKTSDPLPIDDIRDSLPSLNISFSDITLHGLSSSTINYVRLDTEKKKISVSLTFSGEFRSNYNTQGRILVVPIVGDGKCIMYLTNVEIVINGDYVIDKMKDGKDYWKIVKYQIDYSPERIKFDFQNLFNGNKELSNTVHIFANENWLEIFNEVGKPIVGNLVKKVGNQFKKMFDIIPAEEILLP